MLHEATKCCIENFEFIVSEFVQVNPDNSRAMSALKFEYTANKNCQSLSQPKPWCNIEFTPRLLHHDNDIKEVVSSQPSVTWYTSTNQNIGIRTVYEI